MAEIYKLIPSGFSFQKADGYNKVLPITIGKYFEHARGVGTDLYIVKHYTNSGATELTRGYVPTGTVNNAAELREKQIKLEKMLDDAKDAATEYITAPTKVYQSRNEEYAIMFVPCKDGFIGCGWYDHAGTKKKGLKLAAFVLYAYGVINAGVDEVFWEVTYKYLPYDSELGRSEVADKIIFDSMKSEVIRRNNEPTKVVRLTNDTDDNGTN
jgi:hypothetical protein